MIKNRKVKKNWSGEDLKILVWIVAKYCEKKRIKDVYIGIVKFMLFFRKSRIGSSSLHSSQAQLPKCACLSGCLSRRAKFGIKNGKKDNNSYYNSSLRKIFKLTLDNMVKKIGDKFQSNFFTKILIKIRSIDVENNVDSIGIAF